MKSISNTLHSDVLKLLELIPAHVTGTSVRDLELKRKVALLSKKLQKCTTTPAPEKGSPRQKKNEGSVQRNKRR